VDLLYNSAELVEHLVDNGHHTNASKKAEEDDEDILILTCSSVNTAQLCSTLK